VNCTRRFSSFDIRLSDTASVRQDTDAGGGEGLYTRIMCTVAKSLEDWSQFRASHRPLNGPTCRNGAALLMTIARSMHDALPSRINDGVKMNISSCSFARAIAQHQEDRTKTCIAAVAATLRSGVCRKFGLRLLSPPSSPAKPPHVGWSRVALEVPDNPRGSYSATARPQLVTGLAPHVHRTTRPQDLGPAAF